MVYIFKNFILELQDKCHKSQLDVNELFSNWKLAQLETFHENNWKSSLNYIIIYLYVIINHERELNLTITFFWKKNQIYIFGKFFLLLHNSNNKIHFEFYTSVSSKSIKHQTVLPEARERPFWGRVTRALCLLHVEGPETTFCGLCLGRRQCLCLGDHH